MYTPIGRTETLLQTILDLKARGQKEKAATFFMHQYHEDQGKMIGSSLGNDLIGAVGAGVVLSVLSNLPPKIQESTLTCPNVVENLAFASNQFEEKDMLVALINNQSAKMRETITNDAHAARALTSFGYLLPRPVSPAPRG